MKIRVVPVGLIKKYAHMEVIDTTEGMTPRVLIESLAIPPRLKMVAYVNGKRHPLDQPLSDGDEVKLVTLLTGG
jgi:sulfur carrier protein ThiS